MTNFFRTLYILFQNPFVDPYLASFRHVGWACRKIFNLFPCDIQLGDRKLHIPNRVIASGSGALVNALGYYDPNNMFFLEEIFRKGIYDTFFDVGANIGIYSLIVAGRSGKSNVYAFEPHPYTFALLKENIALNHQDDNILCYQMALSDKNGILLFRDAPGDPENHILNESASMDGTIEVKSSRGDAFSIQKGLTPQVIKIDVEGHENHVLAGFSSVLESVQLIFVECWEIEQTVQHLCDKAGFLGPYKIDYRNRQFIHDNIHHEDWVFVNPAAVDVLNQRMFFK